MDFLTQPFRPPPRRKSHSGSPPPPDSHQQPQPSSPTRGSTRKDSISSHGSSQASSEASTSHTPIHQDHLSRFSQLRTASPLPASGGVNGLPDEEKVAYPSELAGDWRAFGRVQGRVVVWEKGTVGVVGEKQLREEKGVGEWVVEGNLWITKTDDILLILDRDHFPPLPIDRSAALSTRTSRPPSRPSSTRGFSSLARRLSRTESGSSTPVLGGRRRSSVGSLGREGTTTPAATATEEDEKNTKSPVLGFLKRVVSPFKRDKGSSPARPDGGDDASLSLQRTRSIEIGKRRASAHRAEVAAREQAQQTIREGQQRASFDEEDEELSTVADDEEDEAGLQGTAIKFEEPAGRHKGPLPDYKGYPITAFLIPSSSHIHSIRFFPAQTSTSSSSAHPTPSSSFFGGSSTTSDEPITTLPPSAPIASSSHDDTDDAPPEGTISFDALLTGTGGGAEKKKNKNKPEVVEYRPPMVEVDVVASIDDTTVEDEAQDGGAEGNKAREVTVGFVFKEVLLAQEATTFHHRLLALLPPSHPQSHSHSHSPTRGRSPSPRPYHETGGGGGGGGFGSALMRTLSGGLSRERSRDPAPPPSAAKEREKDKGKAKEREVQVQAGEPSLGAPVGRRRSSVFGLGGGGGAGIEPTV